MSYKTLLKLIVFATSALMLVACGGSGDDDGTIKIGAIHDLTGPTSDLGAPYADGIRDYVKFVNENGGIDGREVELLSQDYAYAVDQAEQLYSQYVGEGVVAFQGWGTGDTEALKGKIASDEIPFMSASFSAPLANPEEAPYNFVMGSSYSDQFIVTLKHLKNNGIDTVAIMHHDSPFGTSPVADGEEWAAANGVSVIALPMPGGTTDFTAQLTQIKDAGAGAIVIQNVSSPASTVAKDIMRLGMDVQLACLHYCSNELMVDLSGDAAEGMIAATSFGHPGTGTAMEDEIRGWANAPDSLTQSYMQGWVVMKGMVDAIADVVEAGDELTGANIRAALESYSNYSTGGVTAPLSFSADNHLGSSELRIYTVEEGQHVQLTDYISAAD